MITDFQFSQKKKSFFQKNNIRYPSIKVSFALFCLFLSVFFLIAIRIQYFDAEWNYKELLKKQRDIVADITPYELEIQFLSNLENVERIAKNQLNLIEPKKNQILHVEVHLKKK